MEIPIKPWGNNILVEVVEKPTKTASGIILPESAVDNLDEPGYGRIIAAGEGRVNEAGKLIPMRAKVGDVVLFSRYSGAKLPGKLVMMGDKPLLLMRDNEILGTVVDPEKFDFQSIV